MNKIKLLYRKIRIKVLYYWTQLQGRNTFIIDFGNGFYALGERIRVKAKTRKLKSNYTVEASVSNNEIKTETKLQKTLADKIQKDVDKEILKQIEKRRKK